MPCSSPACLTIRVCLLIPHSVAGGTNSLGFIALSGLCGLMMHRVKLDAEAKAKIRKLQDQFPGMRICGRNVDVRDNIAVIAAVAKTAAVCLLATIFQPGILARI